MSNQKCDSDCFNCKFDDCILDYDEVPIYERLDDFILDEKIVKRLERMRQKYKENRDHIRALWDKHCNANKEKFKIYKHEYYIKNKDRLREQHLIYQKKRRQMKAKLKKEKIKPKVVTRFQMAEYQIAHEIDTVETELI